ncbi:MAG: VWA-like domain-containing protein [Pyrobaculum sp.]
MIENKIREAILYLLFKEPLLGYFLQYTDIVIDEEEETASTDGVRIYISPQFFEKLGVKDAAFVLAHEAMHIMLYHVFRMRALERRFGPAVRPFVNIAADAIINTAIQHITTTALPLIFCKTLGPELEEICRKAAFEELVEKMIQQNVNTKYYEFVQDLEPCRKCRGCNNKDEKNSRENSSGACKNNEVSKDKEKGKEESQNNKKDRDSNNERRSWKNNESEEEEKGLVDDVAGKRCENCGAGHGDDDEEDVANEISDVDRERIEREILERMLRSYAFARSIGNISGGVEMLVEQILKPKIDWRSLLRKHLAGGSVKRTWSRVSRKLPDVKPGKTLIGKPKVAVLIDTSGSISDEMLRRFMSELFAIVGASAKVVAIFWDADVQGVYEISKPADLTHVKPQGGGGTMIYPALELLNRKYSDVNYIIIISDWLIGDINDERVVTLLRKYLDRIIAVTVFGQPPQLIKKVITIEP